MIVTVDGVAGAVTMQDVDNLGALSVQLRGCTREVASKMLAGLGRLDGEHVWLEIKALQALSPRADDTDWLSGFEGTMAYAKSKGWLDPDGTSVRAHLAPSA